MMSHCLSLSIAIGLLAHWIIITFTHLHRLRLWRDIFLSWQLSRCTKSCEVVEFNTKTKDETKKCVSLAIASFYSILFRAQWILLHLYPSLAFLFGCRISDLIFLSSFYFPRFCRLHHSDHVDIAPFVFFYRVFFFFCRLLIRFTQSKSHSHRIQKNRRRKKENAANKKNISFRSQGLHVWDCVSMWGEWKKFDRLKWRKIKMSTAECDHEYGRRFSGCIHIKRLIRNDNRWKIAFKCKNYVTKVDDFFLFVCRVG